MDFFLPFSPSGSEALAGLCPSSTAVNAALLSHVHRWYLCQGTMAKGQRVHWTLIDVLVHYTKPFKHTGGLGLVQIIPPILSFDYLTFSWDYPWWLVALYFLSLFDLPSHVPSKLVLSFHFGALLNVVLSLKSAEGWWNWSVQCWQSTDDNNADNVI